MNNGKTCENANSILTAMSHISQYLALEATTLIGNITEHTVAILMIAEKTLRLTCPHVCSSTHEHIQLESTYPPAGFNETKRRDSLCIPKFMCYIINAHIVQVYQYMHTDTTTIAPPVL